jgi:hypothetical protein
VDAASVVERPNNLGEKRKPKAERRLKNYRQYAQAWQSLQTSAVEIQPPIALSGRRFASGLPCVMFKNDLVYF